MPMTKEEAMKKIGAWRTPPPETKPGKIVEDTVREAKSRAEKTAERAKQVTKKAIKAPMTKKEAKRKIGQWREKPPEAKPTPLEEISFPLTEARKKGWLKVLQERFPDLPKSLGWETAKKWIKENTPWKVMIAHEELGLEKREVKTGWEEAFGDKKGGGVISKVLPGGGMVKDFFDRPKSWLQDISGMFGKLGMLINLLIVGIIIGGIVMIVKAVVD